MPIVTIFGGTFGDDEHLARNVAQMLDCSFVGREILLAASKRCEVPEAQLDQILEKEPHWWARWQENLRPYRIALQAAMAEAALAENLVYYGHLGHALLPDVRHVLRVLITAPLEFRVAQVCQRQGGDEKAARHYITQLEKARSRRLTALFGSDGRDPMQHALVLNRQAIGALSAQQCIASAAKMADFQPTAASRQSLADWALAAKVRAHFLTYPGLRHANIEVQANSGAVKLSAIVPSSVDPDEVKSSVAKIPGVEHVAIHFVSMADSELSYG